MRKLILLILIAGLVLSWGCSDDPVESPKLSNVSVVGTYEMKCGDPTCYYQCRVVFDEDPEGSGTHLYWLQLEMDDSVFYSDTVAEVTDGGLDTINFVIPYYELLSGPYWVAMHRVDFPSKDNHEFARSSDTLQLGLFDEECLVTCCTDGYFYAGAYKGNPNIDLVKATIDTPFPRLCGELTGSDQVTHSNVYVGILHQASCSAGDSLYAETGVLRSRIPDPYNESWGWYATHKVPDDTSMTFRVYPDPVQDSPNEPHEYEVYLDVSTGTVTFSLDGDPIHSESDQAWVDEPGDQAVWLAEIRGHETDMARMTDDKECWFNQCKYRDGLGWHDLDLENDPYVIFGSNDDAEWRAERGADSNSFSILDLEVMPQSL